MLSPRSRQQSFAKKQNANFLLRLSAAEMRDIARLAASPSGSPPPSLPPSPPESHRTELKSSRSEVKSIRQEDAKPPSDRKSRPEETTKPPLRRRRSAANMAPPPPPVDAVAPHIRAAELAAEANALEQTAKKAAGTFEHAIGMALPAERKLDELLGGCDPEQTGKIKSKVVFRSFIRKLKVKEIDIKKIDALWSTFIPDSNGATEVEEVKARLLEIRTLTVEAPAKQLEEARRLRAQMALVSEAAALREELEAEERNLASVSGMNAPAIAQLGAIIKKRNIKLGECIRDWGDVTKPQFRKHVLALGVSCAPDAVDALFDLLDEDGGGSLDHAELKNGLKKLLDAALKSQQAEAARQKRINALRREACSQQAAIAAWEQARIEGAAPTSTEAAAIVQAPGSSEAVPAASKLKRPKRVPGEASAR